MKYLKFGLHELAAIALIVAATVLRLIFIGQGGPLTNSDEGTIGIMALHIAYRGEHPIFFYGQYYMGALEAYLAAAFFHLFGPSLFTLRLGLVLLFTGFLVSTYLLTRWLYTKTWALLVLLVLGLGSSYILARELSAIGGYPETLFFGSLSCLLVCWLVMTYNPTLSFRKRLWRLPVYACWGLVAGLGLWSDLLIIPFVFVPGLLLLLICWRELIQVLAALCTLLGLGVGAYPLIAYNLAAAPGKDSLTTLLGLHGSSGSFLTKANLIKELVGTVQVSIPMMTGNPFCPVTELSFLGASSPRSLKCTLAHGVWGFGYLFVFALAFCLVAWAIWCWWRRSKSEPEKQQDLRRQMARLMLLGAGLLSLLLYTFSDAPRTWPGIHGRYIIGLLIATPAILWPLWSGISASRLLSEPLSRRLAPQERRAPFGDWGSEQETFTIPIRGLTLLTRIACGFSLVAFCVVLIIGTGRAFGELSSIQASNQHDQALINSLERLGIKHIYTDYWTCDKIAFVSNEKIICGVVTGSLTPSHNRDSRYYDVVSADPASAYAFPINTGYHAPSGSNRIPFVEQKLQAAGMHYRRFVQDGYIIYLPEV